MLSIQASVDRLQSSDIFNVTAAGETETMQSDDDVTEHSACASSYMLCPFAQLR